jgi:hypothetical protein
MCCHHFALNFYRAPKRFCILFFFLFCFSRYARELPNSLYYQPYHQLHSPTQCSSDIINVIEAFCVLLLVNVLAKDGHFAYYPGYGNAGLLHQNSPLEVLRSHFSHLFFVLEALPSELHACPMLSKPRRSLSNLFVLFSVFFLQPFHCILRISGLLRFNRAGFT